MEVVITRKLTEIYGGDVKIETLPSGQFVRITWNDGEDQADFPVDDIVDIKFEKED